MSDAAKIAPAVGRNREPLLQVLRTKITTGLVLEIASGTGEHAVWFAAELPDIVWQPTDREPAALESIAAWRERTGLANVLKPLTLDAAAPDTWPIAQADAVVAINMIHISPWASTVGLMAGATRILPAGGLLFLYGPFRETDVPLADSNAAFDAGLKARDPGWGLRNLDEVAAAAGDHGIVLEEAIAMPANNLSVVFRKHS